MIRAVDGPLVSVYGLRPEAVSYNERADALQRVWIAARHSLRDVFEQVTRRRPRRGRAAARGRPADRGRGRLAAALTASVRRAAQLGGGDPLDERAQGPPVVADGLEQLRRVDDRLEAVVVADRQRLVPEQARCAGGCSVVAARRRLQHVSADHPAVGLELLEHLRQLACRVPVVVDRARGWRRSAGRWRRRSRRRCGRRAPRPRRTSRWRGRPRRTRPARSCTASCPWRSARRGRAGRPWPRRTPRRARRTGRPSAALTE